MCLENVEQYHKDAELLIAIRSYGHALALVVLSEEEFAKAIMCHLWSEEILSQPSDFRKEEYAEFCQTQRAVGLALSHNLVNLAEEIRKTFEDRARRRRGVISEDRTALTHVVNGIRDDLRLYQKLQEDKERGFYVNVDFENQELRSPASTNKDGVGEYLHQAKKRFELVKPFLNYSFSPSEKKIVSTLLRAILDS
jgi:AbiV family abortive infection protein